MFRIGDPAPIIFWVDQAPYIVEGDAEKAKLEDIFGVRARRHPGSEGPWGMLHDARTGVFKRQQEEWLAQGVGGGLWRRLPGAAKSHEVLDTPIQSSSRKCSKSTQPPHPIDVRLRRASTEWLEKFATKAELPMIASLLGEASQGVYSVRQIAEIMFAYLSNKLSTARPSEINKIAADKTIRSLFAHGMYEFYIQNGWPHAPFQYGKLDFVELMNQRLVQGKESGSWATALQLAKLLFGDKDAPLKVDDAALMFMRPILATYKKVLDEADSRYAYNGMKFPSEGMLDHSREILDCFDRIQEFGCIMIGTDRKNGSMMDGRFQSVRIRSNGTGHFWKADP